MDNFKPTVDQAEQIKFIEELRDLKELKKMTYEQIADKTEENGERVSLSTVKLVFSADKKHNHDYNNTLLPIFNALSDLKDNNDPVNQLLLTRLEIKNETIKQLEDRIKVKDEKHKDREQFFMELIDKQSSEIAFKNEQIRHHNEAMDRKDALIKELYSMLLEKRK